MPMAACGTWPAYHFDDCWAREAHDNVCRPEDEISSYFIEVDIKYFKVCPPADASYSQLFSASTVEYRMTSGDDAY